MSNISLCTQKSYLQTPGKLKGGYFTDFTGSKYKTI